MQRRSFIKAGCTLAAALTVAKSDLTSGEAPAPPSQKGPWSLEVEEEKGIISIRHAKLGVVLNNARLHVREGGKLVPSTGWTVADRGAEGMVITAKAPVSASWEFLTTENGIAVRTAAKGSVITAIAPATVQRIPARLGEAEKMRVQVTVPAAVLEESDKIKLKEWKVTPTVVDYTGEPCEERAYTPPDAPHVMFLALGPVDSLNVHALFDRPTGIALRFADASRLTRDPADAQKMQVVAPIVGSAPVVSLIPDYFVKVCGMPRYVPLDFGDDSYHPTAPTGWNHWLAFFRDVTEQDIVDAADWIEANLKDYGMAHVQLDDGYQAETRRLWDRDWDPQKFPHGPVWLAEYIKSKGFIPGVWTVPYSYCVEAGKPEWFLRDEKGHVAMDYQGGGELDFTRPEVIRDYWIPLMKSLKSQGWGYFKFDMGSTVPQWAANKSRFHDPSKTPFDISVETMKIFRQIMGPEIWHTNHPDNWGGRMGYVDVVGIGSDPGPGWTQMNHHFSAMSNNTYQNHIIWYSDPDCICLRGKPTRSDPHQGNTEFFNLEEARTAATLLSITGLQWLSGDDMPHLEPERVELIKRVIPILPIFPIDLFGRGRDYEHYPQIFDLKVNQPSGKYDAVAVTNWSTEPVTRSVSFEKELALDGSREYLIFDFWKEQLVGTARGSFQTQLPPHGTAVFAIHPLLGRPQLLGNNRHLTGAFGIRKQHWLASSHTLAGTSETVPGATYSLFFHVPKGMKVENVSANAAQVAHDLQPSGLLRVSFTGQKASVDWSVTFA